MTRERVDNPYRPPGAALDSAAAPGPGRRLGWKLYLWLMVISYPIGFALLGVSWMQPLDFVDGTVTVIALAGLFGYAYHCPMGSRPFWRSWLPFQICWHLLAVLLFKPLGWAYQSPVDGPASLVEAALGLLLLVPLYVGLFRYAFRSPGLWRPA